MCCNRKKHDSHRYPVLIATVSDNQMWVISVNNRIKDPRMGTRNPMKAHLYDQIDLFHPSRDNDDEALFQKLWNVHRCRLH